MPSMVHSKVMFGCYTHAASKKWYFIDIKGFAADKGPLELDSRVLGNLVAPLIVRYVFQHLFLYLSYLSSRWSWYILVKLSQRKMCIGLVSLGCFNVFSPYPPFSAIRTGLIICPFIHLPFYSWKYQS